MLLYMHICLVYRPIIIADISAVNMDTFRLNAAPELLSIDHILVYQDMWT